MATSIITKIAAAHGYHWLVPSRTLGRAVVRSILWRVQPLGDTKPGLETLGVLPIFIARYKDIFGPQSIDRSLKTDKNRIPFLGDVALCWTPFATFFSMFDVVAQEFVISN
jgi:hypothetical protein